MTIASTPNLGPRTRSRPVERTHVRTRVVDLADTASGLLPLLPTGGDALTWLRHGEGLVGWGEAARFEPSGTGRFEQAAAWWQEFLAGVTVTDEVGLPGTGPVAFASLAFADDPGSSVLVVPEVVVGRRDGVTWVTEISPMSDEHAQSLLADAFRASGVQVREIQGGGGSRGGATVTDDNAGDRVPGLRAAGTRRSPTGSQPGRAAVGMHAVRPVRVPSGVSYAAGEVSVTDYREAVRRAVERLRDGELDKVVLAHDLVANISPEDGPVDVRYLLHGLADRYPNCWTFSVDGLVGATPELLLRRTGDTVAARVLAGTVWPRDGVDTDALAAQLLASAKNQVEHGYAVASMAEALRPCCAELTVPEAPSVLRLRNVLHLATDIHGRLANAEDTSLLALLEAVHPTAAVGGTPRELAVKLIAELEGMDRGRYAGPVGWIDGSGNGEFGIALRCAQVTGNSVRLFAGCGIVADSDPDSEVLEANAKMVPMRDALENIHS